MPGELTEFAGQRAELTLVHQALGFKRRCLCLFEAADPELIRSVNDIARFPLARQPHRWQNREER